MTEKHRKLHIGKAGEVKLPPDALESLGVEPGDQVRLTVDTRKREVRLERHVEDAWGEALKEKKGKDFTDLWEDQSKREEEAKRIFEEGLKKKPEPRKPEDDRDRWR